MEYTHIINLVPQGEHFDPSAVNEGVWVTETHLGAIENSLISNATGTSAIQEASNEKDQQIQSLTDQLNGQKQIVTDRDATIAAQAIEIANLKAGAAKRAARKRPTARRAGHGRQRPPAGPRDGRSRQPGAFAGAA